MNFLNTNIIQSSVENERNQHLLGKFYNFIAISGIKNPPDIWANKWDEAQKEYPGSLNMEFLSDDFIFQANKYLYLPDEALEAFSQVMSIIRKNEVLSRLLWLNHYILFKSEIEVETLKERNKVRFSFPELDIVTVTSMNVYNTGSGLIDIGNVNYSFGGMFQAILLISGLPRLLRFYKKRNIPEQVMIDTLSDIDIWMKDFYTKNGVWGLKEFWWIFNHFSGRLFRLGRLQFIKADFSGNMRVFRNKNTSRVISISETGIKYRTDGQVDGTNDVYDHHGAWVSNYSEDEKTIKGSPILPLGFAENKVVELCKKEWNEVLFKGSSVLDVHIAAGGKLSHQACGESFKLAVEFFNKYFPEIQFNGFMCTSWLLDPQFQKILSGDSNIVKFQREFYLYPVKSNDAQTFERVFGSKPEDIKTFKAENSMQKAILDYIEKGNHMHYAGMFLLRDDLQHWGEAFYQS